MQDMRFGDQNWVRFGDQVIDIREGGTDMGEFVEIAVDASNDTAEYTTIEFYDGINEWKYTAALDSTSMNTANGIKYILYVIENGSNNHADGIALIQDGSTTMEFWSYEGSVITRKMVLRTTLSPYML